MSFPLVDTNCFNGNPNLKAAFTNISYTAAQLDEYLRCAADPIYFIRHYVKIVHVDRGVIPFDLWPFQEELIHLYEKHRFVLARFSRQVGKTQTTVAFLLWKILFTSSYSVGILAHKMATAKEILDRLQKSYELLPFWLQQGVVRWNRSSIELENGSRIIVSATTGNTIRGFSYSAILLDEFAMVPGNIAEDFMASVFPTISSGKTTQVFILSTPKGQNFFYRLFNDAEKKKNNFVTMSVDWRSVPGRDANWERQQRQQLGRLFEQEHACAFLGSSNTLIDAQSLMKMVTEEPIFMNNDFRMYEEPKVKTADDETSATHTYVIAVDVARAQGLDYSAFSVIDITEFPYKQVAVYRNNTVAPTMFPQYIYDTAVKYNNAFVLIEINDIGAQIADILLQELEYEAVFRTTSDQKRGQQISVGAGKKTKLGVKMSAQVKAIGCSSLKTLIETQKLLIPDDETYSELTTFVADKKSFAAESGANDDIVMTLVLFGWLTSQQYFKDLTSYSLRRKLLEEHRERIQDSMLPMFVVNAAADDDEANFGLLSPSPITHHDPAAVDGIQHLIHYQRDEYDNFLFNSWRQEAIRKNTPQAK